MMIGLGGSIQIELQRLQMARLILFAGQTIHICSFSLTYFQKSFWLLLQTSLDRISLEILGIIFAKTVLQIFNIGL